MPTKIDIDTLSAKLEAPIEAIKDAETEISNGYVILEKVKNELEQIKDIKSTYETIIQATDKEISNLEKTIAKQKHVEEDVISAKRKLQEKAKELAVEYTIIGQMPDNFLKDNFLKSPVVIYPRSQPSWDFDKVYVEKTKVINTTANFSDDENDDSSLMRTPAQIKAVATKIQKSRSKIEKLSAEHEKLKTDFDNKNNLAKENALNQQERLRLIATKESQVKKRDACKSAIDVIGNPALFASASLETKEILKNNGLTDQSRIQELYTHTTKLTDTKSIKTQLTDLKSIEDHINTNKTEIATQKALIPPAADPLRKAIRNYRKEAVQPKFDELAKATAELNEVERKIRAATVDFDKLLKEQSKFIKDSGKTLGDKLAELAKTSLQQAIAHQKTPNDTTQRAKQAAENALEEAHKDATRHELYVSEKTTLTQAVNKANDDIEVLTAEKNAPLAAGRTKLMIDSEIAAKTKEKTDAERKLVQNKTNKQQNQQEIEKIKATIQTSQQSILALNQEKIDKENAVKAIKDAQKTAENDIVAAKKLLEKSDAIGSLRLPDAQYSQLKKLMANPHNRYETSLNGFLYITTEAKYNPHVDNMETESNIRTKTEAMLQQLYSLRESLSQDMNAAKVANKTKEVEDYQTSIKTVENFYIATAKQILANLDEKTDGIHYIRYYGSEKAYADIADSQADAWKALEQHFGIKTSAPSDGFVISSSAPPASTGLPYHTTKAENLETKCRWGGDEIEVEKNNSTSTANVGWIQYATSGIQQTQVVLDKTAKATLSGLKRYKEPGSGVELPPKAILEWALNLVNTHMAEFPNAKSLKITGNGPTDFPEHGLEALILAIKASDLAVELSPTLSNNYKDETNPKQVGAVMGMFRPSRDDNANLDAIQKQLDGTAPKPSPEKGTDREKRAVVFSQVVLADALEAVAEIKRQP